MNVNIIFRKNLTNVHELVLNILDMVQEFIPISFVIFTFENLFFSIRFCALLQFAYNASNFFQHATRSISSSIFEITLSFTTKQMKAKALFFHLVRLVVVWATIMVGAPNPTS